MFARDIETLPRADIQALQLERLKHQLDHAYRRVPHFQHSFDEAGVTPDKLTTLAHLQDFPFTRKTDLRAHYPFGMFAIPRSDVLRVHASSGTTGKPTVVGYSALDLQTWADLMARSLVTMGATSGDILHNANGYGLFTGGLGFHDGAQRLGMTVIPVSGGNTERQIQLLVDFGADVMSATPSYALHIAEVADTLGVDLRSAPLRVACVGAEPWSEALRDELEARLGVKAMNMYGLSEIIGPGVACECHDAQDGLHCWEDQFLFEIIDPKTQHVLPAGEDGELVISTLTKEALPVIRYRTGDMTCLIEEPCICGRTHRRIKRITGRSDDMLIIRGVNIYPSQIEDLLIGQSGIAPHYMLVVERRDNMDMVTIEAEALPEIAASQDAFDKTAADIQRHIKDMAGITCKIDLKQPGDIPRSEGKAVRVRDLRQA